MTTAGEFLRPLAAFAPGPPRRWIAVRAATAVALPLEKQFQTIPGLSVISSTSTLGQTSVTLEFD